MADLNLLDNPAWNALMGDHAGLAQGHGGAARYPAAMSPISAVAGAEGFADLRTLTTPDEVVALLRADAVAVPEDWQLVQRVALEQMVCVRPPEGSITALTPLTEADVPQMLALTKATEPGPFRAGTIGMGRYYGLWSGGELMAMAGERMRPEGFTEVSAVCVAEAYRGRGLARQLVAGVTAQIVSEGRTAFLHLLPGNAAAKGLYQSLGFEVRAAMGLMLVRKR